VVLTVMNQSGGGSNGDESISVVDEWGWWQLIQWLVLNGGVHCGYGGGVKQTIFLKN